MKKNSHILFILLISFCSANAQKKSYSLYASVGPNYYINNIVTFGSNVRPLNYGAFGRLMWNSNYAISLGVETGYNQFYRVNNEKSTAEVTLVAVPVHLVVSMKLTDKFYTSFAFGPSFLTNYAKTQNNEITNNLTSLADGSLSFGYRKQLKRHLSLGAELRCNFSSKNEDINLGVPLVIGYKF